MAHGRAPAYDVSTGMDWPDEWHPAQRDRMIGATSRFHVTRVVIRSWAAGLTASATRTAAAATAAVRLITDPYGLFAPPAGGVGVAGTVGE